MFFNSRGLAVSVYPDSDKIGVYVDETDGLVFKRTAVPWLEGEDGWDSAD